MRKKQFISLASRPAIANIGDVLESTDLPPKKIVIHLPENSGTVRNLDFSKYYGYKCDHIVYASQRALERMTESCIKTNGKTLSPRSIGDYFNKGLSIFLPFCAIVASSIGRELYLEDLNKDLIDKFVNYLRQSSVGLVTQRNRYTYTKSVLIYMEKSGWIARLNYPRNPFPHSNRAQRGMTSLCETERKDVLLALKSDMRSIINGDKSLTTYELIICLLAIAARTGINPTPALELQTDCLQPHPFKHDRYILVFFKRRGYNTHIQSLRRSADIESVVSALPDVARIVDLVKHRNAQCRNISSYPNNLFVYSPRENGSSDEKGRVTTNTLSREIHKFISKHNLIDADGNPLQLSVMRLRKTFENRLFKLSGQDPFLTAKLGGHTLKVSNNHYLEAPESAERDWRLMGEIRVGELLRIGTNSNTIIENTPTARCSDTLNGDFAPKNGDHCQRFLACFRCRSFIVTGDDLYRVYSLYWMLIGIRQNMGANAWKRVYGHIIRIIDNEIAPKFNKEYLDNQRQKAKDNPHPFWRSPDQLQIIT